MSRRAKHSQRDGTRGDELACWKDSGLLEIVQAFLPATIALDSDLHAAEYDFLAAFEIDSQLDNISIVDGVRFTLHSGAA